MISTHGLVNPAVNYGAIATMIDGANTSMKEGAASGAPTGTGVNAAWKRTSVDIGIPVGAGFKPAQIKPADSHATRRNKTRRSRIGPHATSHNATPPRRHALRVELHAESARWRRCYEGGFETRPYRTR